MTLLLVLDLVGVFVFAISGAMLAVEKRLDVFGALVLAGAAALGGGLIRDVLLGATPPAALRDSRYLVVPVAAALLVVVAHPQVSRLAAMVRVFDAAGLGLFTVAGTTKALAYGLGPVPAALLGVTTGIGGGILRDLLAGELPVVLRTEIYALAALLGAGVVVAADRLDGAGPATAGAAAVLVMAVRLLSLRYGWSAGLPTGRHTLGQSGERSARPPTRWAAQYADGLGRAVDPRRLVHDVVGDGAQLVLVGARVMRAEQQVRAAGQDRPDEGLGAATVAPVSVGQGRSGPQRALSTSVCIRTASSRAVPTGPWSGCHGLVSARHRAP